MSKTYRIQRTQKIPIPLEQAWDFFSRPDNLRQITPGNMGFKITSAMQGTPMYAGQIIEYKVSPLAGITFYWMTEIIHVEDKKYFVDEQRYGPFSLWHHLHQFKSINGGVEMTDTVHYKLPFWFLGDIAHSLFVKKKVEQIFEFRWKKVEELFGVVI